MKNQIYVPVNGEAEIVREIFNRYVGGETLKQIADDFTVRQIVYYKEKNTWSKNSIQRIIENSHYIGDDEYQRIIEPDLFGRAVKLKEEKGGSREKDSAVVHYLKSHTFCGQCGKRVTRIAKYGRREKWLCTGGCHTSVYTDDTFFYKMICSVLNRVAESPDLLDVKKKTENYNPDLSVIREEKEISRMFEQTNIQFAVVRKAILDCASSKYDCCNFDVSQEYTDELINYFIELGCSDEIRLPLLEQTVQKITLLDNGQITLCFVNGKEICSEVDIKDDRDCETYENCNEAGCKSATS